MDWEQRDRAPSRGEAARDAHEEWLAETYEERFLGWCRENRRDPEAVTSVLAFEEWWTETGEE